MNKLAEPVASTLGPRSRNVAVDITPDQELPPSILHDGVSVARSISLPDVHEDMGSRLLRAAAIKTNEIAGDGTTTSTILAQSLVNEGFKRIAAGENPMLVKKEIEEALEVVLEELKKLATPVDIKNLDDLKNVASISAASEEIGQMVAEAVQKVGKDGVITVEQGKGLETTIEYKSGLEIDRGYLSQYFVTNQDTVEAVLEDPFILLTDKKINYGHEILPFLEKFVKAGHKNLVVFAGEIIEEALATLVVNKIRGALNVVAIQSPAFGGRRVDELEDIASFVNGKTILEESGRSIESVEIEELGKAKKVVSDRDKTIIFEGAGNPVKRIEELKEQIKIANTPYDREIKENRVANLAGKVAVITIGAITEAEVADKRERTIDAKSATLAAVEEGIIAGGEIALYYLSPKCPNPILSNALKAPFKRLITNSGLDLEDVMKQMAGKNYPFGINVISGNIEDMLQSGIIDPLKVTRSALENACSVATMALTTETLITELIKNE